MAEARQHSPGAVKDKARGAVGASQSSFGAGLRRKKRGQLRAELVSGEAIRAL
jgi:hypothetical protein